MSINLKYGDVKNTYKFKETPQLPGFLIGEEINFQIGEIREKQIKILLPSFEDDFKGLMFVINKCPTLQQYLLNTFIDDENDSSKRNGVFLKVGSLEDEISEIAIKIENLTKLSKLDLGTKADGKSVLKFGTSEDEEKD